jgi:hypothetical protein
LQQPLLWAGQSHMTEDEKGGTIRMHLSLIMQHLLPSYAIALLLWGAASEPPLKAQDRAISASHVLQGIFRATPVRCLQRMVGLAPSIGAAATVKQYDRQARLPRLAKFPHSPERGHIKVFTDRSLRVCDRGFCGRSQEFRLPRVYCLRPKTAPSVCSRAQAVRAWAGGQKPV